ncbi:hypothetical protein D0869_04247 [Hortaea werneckii]|uniref:Major facilitator superfamily (MFS) profile domain-containing protein n=1 Tax=Hortaea werneckii TaxID=91943 RepID=A0A3M6X1V5_HORWE|nr:hypothetical protein D0869_04247 [Hortaea werneckii]
MAFSARPSASMERDKPIDHTDILSGPCLFKAVLALNLTNALAFLDQMAISPLLPIIGEDLHAGGSITWALTSSLVSACIGQCLFGYLSDAFGRRAMIMASLVFYSVGALGCGLVGQCRGPAALFFLCRALLGIANGSLSSLVNIAQNDFLTKERRPLFQGVQGTSVSLGSGIGFTTGALLARQGVASRFGWQWQYLLESILAAAMMVMVYFWVPSKAPRPSWKEVAGAMKSFDWIGALTGMGASASSLILLTENKRFSITSPTSITLIVLAAVCTPAFLLNGFLEPLAARGVRPIVPFRLFRNRTITVIYVQNTLFGMAYYTFMTFLQTYFTFVLGYSTLVSSQLMWPYVGMHAAWSAGSALLIKKLAGRRKGAKSFIYIFAFGFACWTSAATVFATVDREFTAVQIVFLEVMIGLGTGSVFQNSVNAIRCQVTAFEQAVAIGTRNLLRYKGGAIGTAVSSAIIYHAMATQLPNHLQHEAKSPFTRPDFDALSPDDAAILRGAQGVAMRYVWIFAACAVGLCLILTPLVKDRGDLGGLPKPRPDTDQCIGEDVERVAPSTAPSQLCLLQEPARSTTCVSSPGDSPLPSGQITPAV